MGCDHEQRVGYIDYSIWSHTLGCVCLVRQKKIMKKNNTNLRAIVANLLDHHLPDTAEVTVYDVLVLFKYRIRINGNPFQTYDKDEIIERLLETNGPRKILWCLKHNNKTKKQWSIKRKQPRNLFGPRGV